MDICQKYIYHKVKCNDKVHHNDKVLLNYPDHLEMTHGCQSCTISIFPYQCNINYSIFLLINTNININ